MSGDLQGDVVVHVPHAEPLEGAKVPEYFRGLLHRGESNTERGNANSQVVVTLFFFLMREARLMCLLPPPTHPPLPAERSSKVPTSGHFDKCEMFDRDTLFLAIDLFTCPENTLCRETNQTPKPLDFVADINV